jgi:Na+-driven multidrug efflux pump
MQEIGSQFLQIISFGFIFQAISSVLSVSLRAQSKVIIIALISTIGVLTNTILNYGLIYGNLGLPNLGASGAAIATVISKVIEFSLIILLYNKISKFIPKIQLFKNIPKKEEYIKYFKIAAPIIATEISWALGIFLVQAIQGKQSDLHTLAFNISSNVFLFGTIFFMGYAEAGGIMNGHLMGSRESKENIYKFTKNLYKLGIILDTLLILFMVFIGNQIIMQIYQDSLSRNISLAQIDTISNTLLIFSLLLFPRMLNWFTYIGVLRSGGDTTVALVLDIVPLWIISLPLTFYFAPSVSIPILAVISSIDEFVKLFLGILRFKSRKWIRIIS